MAGSPLGAFASPVDLSGGLITCHFVNDRNTAYDHIIIKAAAKYAQWLLKWADA